MISEKMQNIITYTERLLGPLITQYDLTVSNHDISRMGEWFVSFSNDEFNITVSHDRGGYKSIEIGSKIRPKPRAHLREWSLSHIRGFLENKDKHFDFSDLTEQVDWLLTNAPVLLDSAIINSEELRKWATKVSRKLFSPKRKPAQPHNQPDW